MKNQVIEVLNKEHGKRVIEWWKSQGVRTLHFAGNQTKEEKKPSRYYGVIDGTFSSYSIDEVNRFNAEIITLPEDEKPAFEVTEDGFLSFKGLKAEDSEKLIAYFNESLNQYAKAINESDPVNNPSHYTGGSVECIDAMIAAYGKEAVANFCKCNAFKYQWRFDKKNGAEDIKKAQWYQNKFLELKG